MYAHVDVTYFLKSFFLRIIFSSYFHACAFFFQNISNARVGIYSPNSKELTGFSNDKNP
jgi:hypothetical protein